MFVYQPQIFADLGSAKICLNSIYANQRVTEIQRNAILKIPASMISLLN